MDVKAITSAQAKPDRFEPREPTGSIVSGQRAGGLEEVIARHGFRQDLDDSAGPRLGDRVRR